MTSFVDSALASKSQLQVKAEVDEQMAFWFPVAMGVATEEDIRWATRHELDVYNEIANKVYELKYGGVQSEL